MQTRPPGWFSRIVADHLSRLYALSLEGTPGADVLEGTIHLWAETLWARLQHAEPTPKDDGARLEAAFVSLRGAVRRWPPPATFFDHLRPRQQTRPPALPPGDIGEEERARRLIAAARRRAELGLPPLVGQQP